MEDLASKGCADLCVEARRAAKGSASDPVSPAFVFCKQNRQSDMGQVCAGTLANTSSPQKRHQSHVEYSDCLQIALHR